MEGQHRGRLALSALAAMKKILAKEPKDLHSHSYHLQTLITRGKSYHRPSRLSSSRHAFSSRFVPVVISANVPRTRSRTADRATASLSPSLKWCCSTPKPTPSFAGAQPLKTPRPSGNCTSGNTKPAHRCQVAGPSFRCRACRVPPNATNRREIPRLGKCPRVSSDLLAGIKSSRELFHASTGPSGRLGRSSSPPPTSNGLDGCAYRPCHKSAYRHGPVFHLSKPQEGTTYTSMGLPDAARATSSLIKMARMRLHSPPRAKIP